MKLKRFLPAALIILTVIRVGLFITLPYQIFGNSNIDDLYQLYLAHYLKNGQWLGAYTYTTLIKGISYPAFVAIGNIFCLSFPFMLALFYILSAYCMSLTSRNIYDNSITAALVYLFVLYNPTGFCFLSQRVYRIAIIFPAVLLTISCLLNVYYSRKKPLIKQLKWLIFSGLSFLFFYYIREDSIWLLPLFVCALVVTGVWQIFFDKSDKKIKIKRTLLLLLPIIIFISGGLIYRSANLIKYGIFTTNDRTGTAFADVTGLMTKISDGAANDRDYWVSRDTYLLIIENSPSMKASEQMFIDMYDACADETGSVKGDTTFWAFRIAMANLGLYETPARAQQFCKNVYSELNNALLSGALNTDDGIHFSNQSRGFYSDEFPDFFKNTFKNIWKMSGFSFAECYIEPDETSDPAEIRFMEAIAGVNSVHSMTTDPYLIQADYSAKISNLFIKLCRPFCKLLFILGVIIFAGAIVVFIRHRSFDNFEPVIIILGILLSMFLFEFGITVFSSWLDNHLLVYYSAAICAPAVIFETLPVIYLISYIDKRRKAKART